MACGSMGSQVFLFDMLSTCDTSKAKQRVKACKEDSTVQIHSLTCLLPWPI